MFRSACQSERVVYQSAPRAMHQSARAVYQSAGVVYLSSRVVCHEGMWHTGQGRAQGRQGTQGTVQISPLLCAGGAL